MASPNIRKHQSGFAKFRKDWIEPILIAFILAVIIRTFIVQPFKIPSSSMEDTLLVGDQLVAVKFLYGTRIPFTGKQFFKIRDPRPGDVIVFKYPEDPSKDFIKRCMAVGGQTIEIRNKKVYIDGVEQNLPRHAKIVDHTIYPASLGPRDNLQGQTVPPGTVFVMGDNRDNSNDSRYWGTVPVENIKGKAVLLYWSWNRDVPLYDIFHHIRWKRFFNLIR
ncbi:signal peptidase I [bacterium]|nr:signal peptidase I [bacterium]